MTGTTSGTTTAMVTRSEVRLTADPARVLARLFVPGQELLSDHGSRAPGVLTRILALSDDVVHRSMDQVRDRYGRRHRDLPTVLRTNFEQIAHRIPADLVLSEERRDFLGAWFTHEYAIEGAALFNPSVVLHPDQSGLPAGSCRFVLSLRAVGEGHLSSVEFRTGVLGPGGELHLDDPGPHVEAGQVRPTRRGRDLFAATLTAEGADAESASVLIGSLPPEFDDDDLERALAGLAGQRVARHGGVRTDELARQVARRSYEVEFPAASEIAERVLWPSSPAESHGLEDARFVRCADDAGVVYRATYTAFDGDSVAPQLIETSDFRRFRMSHLAGPAARNKGMALFPRTVGGEHVALSRWDRESCTVATSPNGWWWENSRTVYSPTQPWELIQTGNCGSPIETDAGWLVLTHGVGPMREYAIGALLLDLDDPGRVIGTLAEPLLSPAADEREGYVPNVVYSCGALLHGDRLLLPYGVSDAAVRFALVDLGQLLQRLTDAGRRPATLANSSA